MVEEVGPGWANTPGESRHGDIRAGRRDYFLALLRRLLGLHELFHGLVRLLDARWDRARALLRLEAAAAARGRDREQAENRQETEGSPGNLPEATAHGIDSIGSLRSERRPFVAKDPGCGEEQREKAGPRTMIAPSSRPAYPGTCPDEAGAGRPRHLSSYVDRDVNAVAYYIFVQAICHGRPFLSLEEISIFGARCQGSLAGIRNERTVPVRFWKMVPVRRAVHRFQPGAQAAQARRGRLSLIRVAKSSSDRSLRGRSHHGNL